MFIDWSALVQVTADVNNMTFSNATDVMSIEWDLMTKWIHFWCTVIILMLDIIYF